MGEIPRFKRPCPTAEELKALAERPTLRHYEMGALIQGFLPTRALLTHLEGYEHEARALLTAFDRGELTDPARPEAFVRWCIANDIDLPEPFVTTVISRIFIVRRPRPPTTTTEERIWQSGKSGRPGTKPQAAVRGLEAEICSRARRAVIDYVQRCKDMPFKKMVTRIVADQLHRKPRDIDRGYCLKTCVTPADIAAARQRYRSSLRRQSKQ